MVEDVIPDSPADLAGLNIGDEVISVEGNFSGNLQQYKNMLQEPEKKLKIIIKRSGVLLELNMTTWSIL
jgi:predicted metalloprotease with PDZ domain